MRSAMRDKRFDSVSTPPHVPLGQQDGSLPKSHTIPNLLAAGPNLSYSMLV